MDFIVPICIACFGLIVGSFFNVLIWRLPRHESIVTPASHCPRCNRRIRPWENIPVASFILLRGKCAGCRQKISPLYPLIELITAGASLGLWYTVAASRSSNWHHDAHIALQCFALLLMIPVTVIDLRHWIIPFDITIPLLCTALFASFLPGDTTPLQSIFGAVAGGGTLFGIGWLGKIIFRKDSMGGGDIVLLAAGGALWGPKSVFMAFIFGSFFATIAAIILALLRRLPKSHLIPFGPFLALGLWVAVLAGGLIVASYMKFVSGLFFGSN